VTNCSFCGDAIEVGTGKMYIKRDGTVFHFCSAKCQRNQVELGRINRHVRWTQAAADAKTLVGHAATAAEAKSAKAAKAPKAPKAAAAPKAK
jgi:large subunit ribosomal protein L24e